MDDRREIQAVISQSLLCKLNGPRRIAAGQVYQRIAGFLRQARHGAVSDFQHDRAAQHLFRRGLGGRAVLCRFQGESHVPDQRCGIRIAIGGQLKQRHLGRIEHGVHLLEKPVVNSGVVPIQCIAHKWSTPVKIV